MLPQEKEVLEMCRKQHSQLLEYVNRLLALGIEMMRELKLKGIRGSSSDELRQRLTQLLLFVKSCKTLRSIQILCERGFCEDARSLLRVLTESVVNLGYLLGEEGTKRALAFQVHSYLQWERLVNQLQGDPETKTFFGEKFYQDTLQRCQQLRKTYGLMKERVNQLKSREFAWLEDAAVRSKAVGVFPLYVWGFAYASRSVHGTDLPSYFEEPSGDRPMLIKLVPCCDDDDAEQILVTASLAYERSLLWIDEALSFGKNESIDLLQREAPFRL